MPRTVSRLLTAGHLHYYCHSMLLHLVSIWEWIFVSEKTNNGFVNYVQVYCSIFTGFEAIWHVPEFWQCAHWLWNEFGQFPAWRIVWIFSSMLRFFVVFTHFDITVLIWLSDEQRARWSWIRALRLLPCFLSLQSAFRLSFRHPLPPQNKQKMFRPENVSLLASLWIAHLTRRVTEWENSKFSVWETGTGCLNESICCAMSTRRSLSCAFACNWVQVRNILLYAWVSLCYMFMSGSVFL